MNIGHDLLSLSPEDCALLLNVFESIQVMLPKRVPISISARHNDYIDKWFELRSSIQSCAALVPPPLNGDKVWSGVTFDSPQRTIIVRAKSRAEVVRMLNAAGYRYTAGYIKEYWSEDSSFRDYLLAAKERGVYVRGPKGWEKKA
jgi:hypothetical protein